MKKHWLRKCDFLNIPMSICYKNEYFYATNVGAVLTIFCFLIIISITSYEIRILNEKSSFTILSNYYTDLNEILDFSQTPLLFQLANDYGEIIELDEKLFEFKAYDIELIIQKGNNEKRKATIVNKQLELETCDKVLTNQSEYYSSLNLSKYICIKPGQNITSYGLLGDMINGFKGFRIYINKCSGKSYCYNNSIIAKRLQNTKFIATYLTLNTNIYDLNSNNLKYQLISKSCSISTNILKKIYFTFNIGRLNLFNNILFKRKKTFNYIISNSQSLDFDLDSSSTIVNNKYTLAYISFHYSGNIFEVSKEVKRLYDTLTIIGNTFNIALTIFKIINNYYSSKILIADIFKSIFFSKNMSIYIKENNHLCNLKSFKNFKKINMDISDEIGFNNNFNKTDELRRSSKKIIMMHSDKNNIRKSNTKFFNINTEKLKFPKNKLIYFYLYPLCILKKNKSLNNIYLIKDKICAYFSVEKINELIIFKETLEDEARKSKINNTELIPIKNNIISNNYSSNLKNNNNFVK